MRTHFPKGDPIRKLIKKKGKQFLEMRYDNVLPCPHSDRCQCPVIVKGVPDTPYALFPETRVEGTKEEQAAKIISLVNSLYRIVDGQIVPMPGDYYKTYLAARLAHSPNMQIIPPLLKDRGHMLETPSYDLPPIIRKIYQEADRRVLPRYFSKRIDFETLHSTAERVSPYLEFVRQRSAYWMTFGTINGKGFRTAALENANGIKTINAILGYSGPVKHLNPLGQQAFTHIDEAISRLYNAMGFTQETLGQERSVVDFDSIASAYLGSSAGLNPPTKVKEGELDTGERVRISSTGKKLENLELDMQRIIDLLEDDTNSFDTYFEIVGKVENFFSWTVQKDPVKHAAWKNKMRLFYIPTSTFVLMEKIVSKVRMKKERGKVIRIGMKWAHGGADELAKSLKIDLENCMKLILVEGDLKKMDQTVKAIFTKLYMQFMLVHEDPTSTDYPIKVKILEYLIPRLVEKLVRLYGDVWVKQVGTVPSGCFNTSHMDSWVMGLYFFLFCTVQLHSCPDADRVELEQLIEEVAIVLYGDDHLYNKGEERVSHYLSAWNFQSFLKQALEVDLKDIYDGLPFVSSEDRGRIKTRGACFLKQFFVLNPYKGEYPNQPDFLPYREINEIMIRLAYGRESTTRTLKEIALACVGHAYATFASNRIAYDMILEVYRQIIAEIKTPVEQMSDLAQLLQAKSMRKLRVLGLTAEQLKQGFPTWEALIKQNEKIDGYHTMDDDLLELYSPFSSAEW